MARRYARRRRGRRFSVRRGVKRAVRKFKKRVFRKRVQRIIQSSAETKTISNYQSRPPLQLYSSNTAAVATNMWCLTPSNDASLGAAALNIAKGTADGQRVGNKVRLKKAMFNITMTASPYSVAQNPVPRPQLVRMFFFRKKVNANTLPTQVELCGTNANGDGGNFFQNGTTQGGMTGTFRDMNQIMNSDMYTYISHKSFKIAYSEAFGDGAQIGSQYFTNNDFKYNVVKRMNVTKMLPKQFKWNDNDNIVTPPTLCLIQTVNADGSVPSLVNTYPLQFSATLQWEYTDM